MPTNDSRIFETAWFVNPKMPLMEHKVYYAKVDNTLYYITTHRGPTTDDLVASDGDVKSMILVDSTGKEDKALEAFNALQKALDKPA